MQYQTVYSHKFAAHLLVLIRKNDVTCTKQLQTQSLHLCICIADTRRVIDNEQTYICRERENEEKEDGKEKMGRKKGRKVGKNEGIKKEGKKKQREEKNETRYAKMVLQKHVRCGARAYARK